MQTFKQMNILFSTNIHHQSDQLKPRIALYLEKGQIEECERSTQSKPQLCTQNMYRTYDGTCNNVENPNWGSIGDAFLRIVPPRYSDGKQSPRESSNSDKPLPHAESVARLFERTNIPIQQNTHLSILFALWGQLISEDIAKITQFDQKKDCCGIDDDDKTYCYAQKSETCKEYKRTAVSRQNLTCKFDFREQLNGASSFLDGSEVYKTSLYNNSFRTFTKGMINLNKCDMCKELPKGILYRSLFQEHNRISEELSIINPLLNDDELFFQSRRIIISEIQQITFNEFLPVLLGHKITHKFNFTSSHGSYYTEYSRIKRPGTYNEAAVIGFDLFKYMSQSYSSKQTSFLSQIVDLEKRRNNDKMNEWDPIELMVHRARDHVGGLLEDPHEDAVFGPTISCIFTKQFEKLRNTDKFWFENNIPPLSFEAKQLKAIHEVSLASLLCSSKVVKEIQPRAFYNSDKYLNAPIKCENIAQLNLKQLQNRENKFEIFNSKNNPSIVKPIISEKSLNLAFTVARDKMLERRRKEYDLWVINGGIDAKSPEGTAASFSKANRNAILMANSSLFYEIMSNEILHIMQKNRRKRQAIDDFSNTLQFIDINSVATGSIDPITMEPQCEDFAAPCDTKTQFRTLTGHCNNIKNPSLGRSLTTFARLLPAVYEDGISAPRTTSVNGQLLPNPRSISSLIHPDISNLHTRYSLITMQFAQFLDHDLTMTPIHKGFHESIPSCRACNSAETVHPECNPIPIPPNDFFFPELNITDGSQFCFPFMRSLPGQQTLGPREQINQNTAFLDASQVYGENSCICRKLRGFSGRMNSTTHPIRGKELLPQSPSHPECKTASGYCFIAGDGRASEQPGLTVIHTLFLREHNRIVEGLRGVNPHWNGEQLFDHARRINIAINQHITYNEFLPRVLSWNAVNLYGLKLLSTGYYKEYNPSCNPAIVTEFATAAYRIGHSLLRPHIPRLSLQHQPIDPPILLRDGFFKVDMILQPGMVDEISRGLVATPMETLDQFVTGEVTNHLFEDRRVPFSGIDLVALNIQRGRDHGIPSYNNYRALCNLKRAQTWEDLNREIPPEVITRLRRIYANVDDIDLFPGGMSERPLQGGLVGPTFACIIAIQFRQLRKCDRFWYENNDPILKFSEAQLAEIRKITLAKVICENLDFPGEIQRAAFDLPSNFLNPRVSCQSLPQIDLNAWRENIDSCQADGKNIRVGESAFPTPCTSCICTKEGLQCASLRITDCAELAREWAKDAILRDEFQQSNSAANKLRI
uniref:CSON007160 protein n=2 Tax=Culicoides sonorensis TaxID=179676 RepID=A0A336LIY5_CULSO